MIRRTVVVALVVALAGCGGGGDGDVAGSTTSSTAATAATTTTTPPTSGPVRWQYDGSQWQPVSGTPPTDCQQLDSLPAPSDLAEASAVLYPGQVRGGDYKAHGGFRFDGAASQAIEVRSPIDGVVTRVSRYLEGGDVQHLVEIVSGCGVMVRFDHIATPGPLLQPVFDALPPPQPDDSHTTNVDPPVVVAAGDVVATAVGHPGNVSYDFGVYDLRQPNGSDSPPGELSSYAICWLDLVTGARDLPPGDPQAGATSDYCT